MISGTRQLFSVRDTAAKMLSAWTVVVIVSLTIAGCGRPADQSPLSQPDFLDKVIHFNGSHEAEPFKVSGWSPTETNFTWTEGRAAVLAFPVPPNCGGVRLKMLVSAYTHPPELPSQPVEVFANGQKVAEWGVVIPAENTADISQDIVGKGTTLTIQFRTPRAAAPAEFSARADPRVLGICCHEMQLTKLAAP
jgi:hypothetical protein